MRRTVLGGKVGMAVLVCLALSASVSAQNGKGGGGGGGKLPGGADAVSVTVLDAFGQRIQSDGQGSYVGGISGGTFKLDINSRSGQSDRRLQFDFTDCEMNCTAPFDNTVILGADIQSNNKDLDVNAIPAGSTLSDRFKFRFTDPGGDRWVIRFFGDTETCGTALPSGMVTISRSADGNDWTINAPAGAVGCLLKITKAKGGEAFTPHGRYRMPFSLTFTRP